MSQQCGGLEYDLSLFNVSETNRDSSLILATSQSDAIYKETPLCLKYRQCKYLKRLLISLKYYAHIEIQQSQDNAQIFCNFMDQIYEYHVYDDFHHLLTFHQQHLELIKEFAMNEYEFATCDLSQCNFANRHFETKEA